jgi:hypothetical protein
MLTPSGPMGQAHWGDTASNSPSATAHSAEAQLKVCHTMHFISFFFPLHLILINCNLSVTPETLWLI